MNYTILLQIGQEGVPPTEFRIFAMGKNRSSKGTVTLDAAGVKAIMAAFAAQGMDKMPVDYGHGMVFRDDHKSAGWFDLEPRDDGLWAVNVEWTPKADRALRDREFRFISPAFRTDDKGRVVEMLNVALTNLPATKDALPLVAHYLTDPADDGGKAPDKGKEKNPMSEKVFKALGAADEGEALVIATEINAMSAQLLTITGTKKLDDAMAAIRANAALPAEIVTLSEKLKAYEQANLARDRDALIETLSTDGKLPPALHEWAKTQTIESLNTFGQSAPVLGAPAGPAGTPPADAPITLSDEDQYMLAQFGIESEDDKKAWLAIRREELAKKAKE